MPDPYCAGRALSRSIFRCLSSTSLWSNCVREPIQGYLLLFPGRCTTSAAGAHPGPDSHLYHPIIITSCLHSLSIYTHSLHHSSRFISVNSLLFFSNFTLFSCCCTRFWRPTWGQCVRLFFQLNYKLINTNY